MKNNKFQVIFKTICKLIGYGAVVYYAGTKIEKLLSIIEKCNDNKSSSRSDKNEIKVILEFNIADNMHDVKIQDTGHSSEYTEIINDFDKDESIDNTCEVETQDTEHASHNSEFINTSIGTLDEYLSRVDKLDRKSVV